MPLLQFHFLVALFRSLMQHTFTHTHDGLQVQQQHTRTHTMDYWSNNNAHTHTYDGLLVQHRDYESKLIRSA